MFSADSLSGCFLAAATNATARTKRPDEETANVAREKQEAIRAQAVNQMPVQYVGEVRGRVFASG